MNTIECPTPDLNPNDLYSWAKFIKWLTPDGVDFFHSIMNEDGTIPLVIPSDVPGMPEAVHFTYGMQVRNWMRENGGFSEECIENHWRAFVMGSLAMNALKKAELNISKEDENGA